MIKYVSYKLFVNYLKNIAIIIFRKLYEFPRETLKKKEIDL